MVESSQALSAAFRQNELDVAFVIGAGESEPYRIEQWRGQLRWFGRASDRHAGDRPAPLVVPPEGSLIHEAATGALRAHGRKFDIVCTSSDFAVLAAAAAAGLGVMPMIEGLAAEGLRPCLDKSFRLCRRSRCCCWRVPEPWRSRAAAGLQAWSKPFNRSDGAGEDFTPHCIL